MDNATENNAWDIEPDSIDADNINREIPKELWDNLLWLAVKAAIAMSETKEEVLRRVKLWNTHNDPQLPEKTLVQKTLWAMRTWDNKFASTG